mgnify:CR=1 FL=1
MVKCQIYLVLSIIMAEGVAWESDVSLAVRKYALQNSLEYEGKGQSGSVLGRLLSEREDLRSKAKQLMELVDLEVIRANRIALESGIEAVRLELEGIDPAAVQRERHRKNEGLRELPGDTSEVVLRFAPNPNGPLSIGHSRGVVINSKYAEEYKGKMVLRFDDTDTKVKPPLIEAYAWIEEEYEWLSGKPADIIVKASERMPIYLKFARKMIRENIGYVCRCKAEEFRKFREVKISCPCRDTSTEENLHQWEMMVEGKIEEGDAVVRVRTDMSLPNPALRDWPALRIQHSPHPLVGDRYKVWPLLDFQSAIEDHEQGVTHIIRGKDLMDSTRKQTILYDNFGWTYPETLYWGRVKVNEFGGFSTSSIRKSIEEGKYLDWNDPRLPTIKALRGRGFEAQSIREFWSDIGLTQKDISISMKTIESFNSSIIDSKCERRAFVAAPLELNLDSEGRVDDLEIPKHPDKKIIGNRKWEIGGSILIQSSDLDSEHLRLKEFADVEIRGKNVSIQSHDRTDSRKIIHWIPANMGKRCVLATPIGDDLIETIGFIEDFELDVGVVYQFERLGFARVESIDSEQVRISWLHN